MMEQVFSDMPNIAPAFRFVLWSSMLACVIVIAYYIRQAIAIDETRSIAFLRTRVSVPINILLGMAGIGIGIALHQLYYWSWHRELVDGNTEFIQALRDVKSLTNVFLMIICVSSVLVMSQWMRRLVGAWWPVAGAVWLAVLFAIGYGDAAWL